MNMLMLHTERYLIHCSVVAPARIELRRCSVVATASPQPLDSFDSEEEMLAEHVLQSPDLLLVRAFLFEIATVATILIAGNKFTLAHSVVREARHLCLFTLAQLTSKNIFGGRKLRVETQFQAR